MCSLCNKWFHHCQKVTVVFITNTYCSTPTWYIVRKLKQVMNTSISGTNKTQACRHLRHSLVRASSTTVCRSKYNMSIIYCFKFTDIFWWLPHCFPDFIIMRFRPELLRQPPHILQNEFWGLTCNMPLKSAAIPIFFSRFTRLCRNTINVRWRISMIHVYKISWGIGQWTNFASQSTFATVMIKSGVYCFSETQCTCNNFEKDNRINYKIKNKWLC